MFNIKLIVTVLKKKFLSLFLTLRSFSITFSICYWIHQKNSESYSFAIAIEWVWRVFHKTFHHRTYSGLWTTQPLTFTVVFVLWDSAENSPCKLNVFIKRYTVFVKSGDNMHDALLFTPLKKLSYILIQWPLLVSFLRLLFFIGSFEYFCRIKQGKFHSEKLWFWFQIGNFCEKLLVMCLNGVQSSLQHLTTYLYYSIISYFSTTQLRIFFFLRVSVVGKH